MSGSLLTFAPMPPDADPAGAFNDQLRKDSPFVLTRLGFVVPGEYFYYPLSLVALLQTDATVVTREGLYYMLDQNGNIIIQQPVTATQPASKGFVYNFNISTGAGYSDGLTNFAAPLPPRLLLPSYEVGFQVNSVQPGDTGFAVLSVIKIPRQRPRTAELRLLPIPMVA